MANGLFMSKDEFNALPKREQLGCLYENQVITLKEIKGYKFHQKIQYPWLTIITFSMIFLIKTAITT